MISSKMDVVKTNISFTPEMLANVNSWPLDKLDTGFFNLYLGSELTLRDNTEINSLTAQKQSVLSAISQSNVYMYNDVRFVQSNSASTDGYTLSFKNTGEVNLADTLFEGNHQINIRVENCDITLSNSTFIDGKKNHISGRTANLTLDGVTMKDSYDYSTKGHGIYCKRCTSLTVKNSLFQNMTSLRAPAIRLEDQWNITSVIENSQFKSNRALEKAGAI